MTVKAGRLEQAVDLVRARRCAAQLCVIHDGQVVLDRSFGCAPDSLFWLFSASKPAVALAVHLLASVQAIESAKPSLPPGMVPHITF